MYNSGNSSKNVTGASIVDGTVEAADLATAVNSDIADGVAGKATADLALPKTGGTMTGNITLGTNTIDGLEINTTATSNLGLGTGAVDSITTGDNNTGVGDSALTSNTEGINNTAIGYRALYSNVIGTYNSATGSDALFYNTGSYNTASGYRSLFNNLTGTSNTAYGYRSLYLSTGDNNTALGSNAGDNITTGSSNIIIGAGVDAPSATASNQLNIGNWIKGASGVITIPKTIITGGITGTASPTQYANSGITVDDGAATSTYGFAHKGAGKYLRIGLPNTSFAYFETDAAAGFNFNDDITATAHLVSSDYRLKENVVPMVGSIDRLKQLKPSRFNFIKEPLITVDGFLAHEAGNVIPECASGTKDAMIDEEYEVTPAVMDGDTVVTEAVIGTRSVPAYQGIDQAKIVPLLVASLQEAIARIEVLENA